MSTGSDRVAARRAAFRDALRRADLVIAARAAARLQAHAAALDGEELRAARAARIAFGRAIRDARARRATTDQPVPHARAATLLRRPRRLRLAAAAAIVLLALSSISWT